MKNAIGVNGISDNFGHKAWRWLATLSRRWRPRRAKQLRLCETLTLGERGFVAVIEFEQKKLIIGGAGNSMAVLAALSGEGIPPLNHTETDEEIPTFEFASQTGFCRVDSDESRNRRD